MKIPGTFAVVQCPKCGLVFINPQPDAKEIGRYYPDNYFHYQRFDSDTQRSNAWERLVLTYHYGYPQDGGIRGVDFLMRGIASVLKYHYHGLVPYVPDGKLLDLGCGSGEMLYKLKALGWDTYGVEISRSASQYAQEMGLKVYTGRVEEVKFPDGFFDVIRLYAVFEHLPNPVETLLELRRILKSSGRILMVLQNIDSLNYRLFRDKWFHLDVPRHLFSFSPKTLSLICSKAGLTIEKITTFSGVIGLLMSLHYLIDERGIHGGFALGRKPIARKRWLRRIVGPLMFFVDRTGYGDLMEVEIGKGNSEECTIPNVWQGNGGRISRSWG